MRPPEQFGGRDARYQLSNKPNSELDEDLCSYLTTYPKAVTIQHWQLRDLVHCPSKAGEVFAVNRGRILQHDLANCRTHVAADLTFDPTCIAVASGYLAAGGQNSQLDFRASPTTGRSGASSPSIYKGLCGGSVNNALRIAQDASQSLRLFVCNNDDTIKIFSLAMGSLVSMVSCPVAINHCALSPRGTHLVCVGDNSHTYVYQATHSAYRPQHVYTESSDAGMSCDWGPSGSCFAAASQDGSVVVYDHRIQGTVARFYTPLACRNVRFSPAPLDLLAFTEHRGRCHLADSRMWPRQQVLHVSDVPEVEPDISGLAFSPCGSVLYVGLEDGIVAYDIDTVGRRSFGMASIA